MWRDRPIARFLGWLAVLYALLIAPWPGLNSAYGRWFRWIGGTVFAGGDRWFVKFEADPAEHPLLDTQITIADPGRANPSGRMPARILHLDSRGIGWVPTALLTALTLATPIPWRRRAVALLVGLLLVQGFILGSVGSYLWSESAKLGLITPGPFWKAIADGLTETLIVQLGAGFAVPALIWLVVCFRIEDLASFTQAAGLAGRPGPGGQATGGPARSPDRSRGPRRAPRS
jgi:hypothetical protein